MMSLSAFLGIKAIPEITPDKVSLVKNDEITRKHPTKTRIDLTDESRKKMIAGIDRCLLDGMRNRLEIYRIMKNRKQVPQQNGVFMSPYSLRYHINQEVHRLGIVEQSKEEVILRLIDQEMSISQIISKTKISETWIRTILGRHNKTAVGSRKFKGETA